MLGPFSLFNTPSPAPEFISTEFEYPVEIFHGKAGWVLYFAPLEREKKKISTNNEKTVEKFA